MIFSIYCIECNKSIAYSKIPLIKPEIIYRCKICDLKQKGDFDQMPMPELYKNALEQLDKGQYAFSVVLSYTNIELLIEHFLIHMLIPKINDRNIIKFFLRKNSNIKFRIEQLFKVLVGQSYLQMVEQYIEDNPTASDLKRFDEISKFRNEMLHRGRWTDEWGIGYQWVIYDFLPCFDELLDDILIAKNMDYYNSNLGFIEEGEKYKSYP